MSATTDELLHLTVELWHPSCWTLETTNETDAGLYAHTTIPAKDMSIGLNTFYGQSQEALDALTDTVQESSLTESVTILPHATTQLGAPDESTTRRVLVEYNPDPSIRQAFTSRGFVHYGPTRHERGREQRSLLVWTDRQEVKRALEEIEREYDADVHLRKLTTVIRDYGTQRRDQAEVWPGDHLSSRQREAFLLARSHGYYEYPRETTARELAAELNISKTTFLEHLRKAEAKLLTGLDPL